VACELPDYWTWTRRLVRDETEIGAGKYRGDMRIVIVCTGNVCRSPIAEGLFRSYLRRSDGGDVAVSSMGVRGLEGFPADRFARIACEERGIDISGHRARGLAREELMEARLVFTMDLVQKDILLERFPQVEDRVYLLAAWPAPERITDVVPDPVGRSLGAFRRAFTLIDDHVQRIVSALPSSADDRPPSTGSTWPER